MARLTTTKFTAWIGPGLVGLYVVATYLLQIAFNYPQILKDNGELGLPLLKQGGAIIWLAFLGLALAGVLLSWLALGVILRLNLPTRARRGLLVLGISAGASLALVGLGWLIAGPLLSLSYVDPAGRSGAVAAYNGFRLFVLTIGNLLFPLLASIWTFLIAFWLFQTRRGLGLLGLISAIGLEFGVLRGLAWLVGRNIAGTDITDFNFETLFNLLYLAGESLWLSWLLWLSLGLLRQKI